MTALLDEAGRKRVAEAIEAAEARTALEIVLAVVPRSADYTRFVVPPAFCATLLAGLGLHALAPELGAPLLLLALGPIFALFWGLGRLRPIAMRLAPDEAEIAAVHAEALRLFAAEALFETRSRAGVLILLSEHERRVELLGDRGINAVIGPEGWSAHVAQLQAAIRRGETADALVAIVGKLAEAAAAHLPADGAGDELPNQL
jgi:putative membrane protein